MTSQLYLSGRLANNPEVAQTKKGKLLIRLVLETNLSREVRPGEIQTEVVALQVTFFSGPAEEVRNLKQGDPLTVGAHLYGTEFQTSEGSIKRGIQLIADCVFLTRERIQ